MDNKPSTSLPVNIKLMVNMRKFWSDTIDPQLIFCIEIPIKKHLIAGKGEGGCSQKIVACKILV